MKIYNTDEKVKISENMVKYGGGFVNALGKALSKADNINSIKIFKAFPEYCKQYLNF